MKIPSQLMNLHLILKLEVMTMIPLTVVVKYWLIKKGTEGRKRSTRTRVCLRRGATILGGLGRGVRTRGSVGRGVRTRGGLTRQPSNTTTGKRKRDDLQDDCLSENESSNLNYEQPVNRDPVNVDNPVDDNTNGND